MAIVEMKHVDMLALESDRHALLAAIQKLGCFQLMPADAEDVTFNKPAPMKGLQALEDTIARVSWAIGKLNRYDTEKKPLMGDKPTIDETQATAVLEAQPELMAAVEKLEALEREAGDLRGQTARVEATREQLAPWRGLALPLDEVQSTRNTVAALGTVQKASLEQWLEAGTLGELCTVDVISTQRDSQFIYVLCYRDAWPEALRVLKTGGYTSVTLPQTAQTVAQMLQALDEEQQAIQAGHQAVQAQTAAMGGRIGALRQLFDILSSRRARYLAAHNFSVSDKTFFLQGWVPEPAIPTVEKRLAAVSPTVALRFYDAAEGEEPPVILHNNRAVSPFETVVSSFSMPAAYSVDPTAIMMPFFINFMGMMVSDAGYGLVMAILSPILIKILKPAKSMKRMLWIIFGGGIMTVFWGAMYNSWFGYAPLPLFLDPMNNALPVMGLCIGLGAVHLFVGLGMAAYLNIRRHQFIDVLYDQISWFMLIVGLGLLVVVPAVGKWIAIAGAGIIVLTAGRAKSKNPIKRLISGLGALDGVTSWVSDLLSYIRLFGMGLATGVIGMVINILVGMVAGGGGVFGIVMGAVVFVGGHLFNAGINIFGAYVHSCRLQYIEFFGKFFEDGGKPFKPLIETSNYVYISDAQSRA